MNRADARSYDLFKTIVAVILALILLLMLLRGCSTNAAASAPTQVPPVQNPTRTLQASPAVTKTVSAVESMQTSTSSPEPTAAAPTATPMTEPATVTPTVTPPGSTETATATPEQATPAPAQSSSCNTASPSHLSVGQTARVLQRLNVRSEPSIRAAIIKVNRTNSQVQVTGGPVCEPVGNHAYLWWQVQLPDGTQGWSAETPLNSSGYFLEPVQ
jgi:hypothetical protein